MQVADDEVARHRSVGAAYEGPPDACTAATSRAAFDEVLGMTQSLSGTPGMTGMLTVSTAAHAPAHRPSLRHASRRVDGRKIYTEGTLYNGEVVCAEGEALFISVDFAKFEAMRAQVIVTSRTPAGERRDVEHLVAVAFELHRPDARHARSAVFVRGCSRRSR